MMNSLDRSIFAHNIMNKKCTDDKLEYKHPYNILFLSAIVSFNIISKLWYIRKIVLHENMHSWQLSFLYIKCLYYTCVGVKYREQYVCKSKIQSNTITT